MRANLQRVSALVRRARGAPIFERATVAMQAVDSAAALMAEMVERIERLEEALKEVSRDIEAKGEG